MKTQNQKTENATPKWAGVVEIYMAAIQNSGSEDAKTDIRRMAKIADERNELVKALKKLEKEIERLNGLMDNFHVDPRS